MMKKLGVVVGIVLAAGCSGSGGDIAKLRDAKDKICSCKDAECAFSASKDVQELSKRLKDNLENLSADQRAEVAKISREMVECVQQGR